MPETTTRSRFAIAQPPESVREIISERDTDRKIPNPPDENGKPIELSDV